MIFDYYTIYVYLGLVLLDFIIIAIADVYNNITCDTINDDEEEDIINGALLIMSFIPVFQFLPPLVVLFTTFIWFITKAYNFVVNKLTEIIKELIRKRYGTDK